MRTASSFGRPLPRISVVTPSLDQGRFLEECLNSVEEQRYPFLEHLVIDGGSSDGSLEILRSRSDRLSFWTSEPDQGQGHAVNKGLKRATGDLVAWLNADDTYLPGALFAVADAWLRNPSASFYFGDGLRVDEAGRALSGFFPGGRVCFSRPALIHGLNHVLQPAAIINRPFLDRAGLLDPSLKWGMDTDLWIRLSGLAEPEPVHAMLATTREWGATKTSTGSFERIEELRRIAERHGGGPITPGVLCYLLDTLHRFSREREEVFPPSFRAALEAFWASTGNLLGKWGARPDGFPIGPGSVVEAPPPSAKPRAGEGRPRVGIELRQITLGGAGGLTLLLKGVLEALFARHPEFDFTVFCTIFNRGLLKTRAPNVSLVTLPTQTFFADVDRTAAEQGIDVLLRSYPIEDALAFPLERQVFIVPDIQHEILPEFFPAEVLRSRRTAFNRALSGAGAVGTLSEHARRTLLDYEWTRCRRIFLVGPALQAAHAEAGNGGLSTEESAQIPEGDFFIYPANLWPHKNHRRLLEAFAIFLERSGRRVELVLTGHPDGWPVLRAEFPGLPVRHLGFVRPELLRRLFERARALVFFSLFEGFGMPLLEAFDASLPVICSGTTSLPEVGGDAVLTCDPEDPAAMAGLMERVLDDEGLRAELVRRGKERLGAFSWERSADNLAEALADVAAAARDAAPASVIRGEEPEPLVSIVTPSFNQARFLRRTIESVLKQTYPKIEYTVVDGGSTDGSREILRSYDGRFTWVSEPDHGQAHAINKGFALSKGEVRAYLNSDDVLEPDAVARAVRWFRERPACDMVYGRALYVDEDDRVTGLYRTAEYSFERLLMDNCVCQPAAFWRSRIARRVGEFDEGLQYALDYDYWLRIDRAGGRIEHTPELLASSRLHPGTKTLSARERIYGEIFRVCRSRAGRVSYTYFLGLWQHRVHEKRMGWPHLLGSIPGSYRLFARLHWLRNLEGRPSWRSGVKSLGRTLRVRAPRLFWALYYRFEPLLAGLGPGGSTPPVTGCAPNGWMGPECRVALPASPVERSLRLAGVAPVDSSLTVLMDGRSLGEFPLKAETLSSVDVALEPGRSRRLVLRFSAFEKGPDGRRLAFRVEETNLFTEADAHWR